MTVQTNTNSIAYIGNGSTVHYDYDFLILDDDHLKVYFGDVLQTSGYVVSGAGSQSGGTVAFSAAPPNLTNITLTRDVPFLQLTDYQPYDAFPADSHERALDLLTMMVQQLKDISDRSMQYPVGGDKWNAKDNEIINVGLGLNDTSAPNIGQVKSLIASLAGPDSAAMLRAELAGVDGVLLVNGAIDSDSPIGNGYKSTNHYGAVIVGDNPLGSSGNDFPLADSLRDAVNVSRKLIGEPTNCHAFADKTIIDSPSDYGGYGAFDATTVVRGPHNQDHVAAFQARIKYSGTGSIESLWGLLVTPVADSTGTVKRSIGVDIAGVTTSTAIVERSIGVNITQTATTIENVGVKVSDAPVSATSLAPSISFLSSQGASGYSFAGNSGGHLYNAGGAGFGVDPKLSPSYKLMVSEDGGITICGLGASAFTGAYMATPTDVKVSFYSGGASRLSILSSGNSNALVPGADNAQPLGNSSSRWSVVYAGTGTINTSDASEKTKPREISDALLDVADCISIDAWKWLEAVAKKGEDSARWHFGPIAQQVRDSFAKYGLDGCDYGLLCYDKWDDQFENEFAEDSKTVIGKKLVVAAGERWGIRPDQCLWFKMAAVERRCAKIEERLSKAGL